MIVSNLLFYEPVYSGPEVQGKEDCQAKQCQVKKVITFTLLQGTVDPPHSFLHGKAGLLQGLFLHVLQPKS